MQSNELLNLRYLKNDSDKSRFGFVVGKKVSNKAVTRNRIKRMLRESFKAEINNIAPGYDIIVSAQKDFSDQTLSDTRVHVEKLLKKTKLYE